MFNWIQLRTVRRLIDETNIFRENQIFRAMPPRLIDLHHHKIRGEVVTHLFEEDVHHVSVGIRKNEKRHLSYFRSNSGIGINIFTNELARCQRTDVLGRPCPSWRASSSETDWRVGLAEAWADHPVGLLSFRRS